MSFSGRPWTIQLASSCPQPPPSIMPGEVGMQGYNLLRTPSTPNFTYPSPWKLPPCSRTWVERVAHLPAGLNPAPQASPSPHHQRLSPSGAPSPALLKPQPRKNPRSSGASPIRGLWSGVKDSEKKEGLRLLQTSGPWGRVS